jgi:HPr kinase/phosphorylase
MAQAAIHATCVIIGESGLLIRGEPGAGKSRLARALLAEARRRGWFGRLIGDDRIMIEAAAGRLIARGHPAVAGLIEARGVGVLAEPAEPACVVRLVIDLAADHGPRMPEAADQTTDIAGLPLPRLALAGGQPGSDMALDALLRLSS